MKIGILETGRPSPSLEARFGRYDTMFVHLLGEQFATKTYRIMEGEFPEHPEAEQAYLITGSPAGVYDDLPWIPRLKTFLGGAKGKAKLVGICFGHQIMAEAFGGRVEKSAKGWGIGLHRYDVRHAEPWMDAVASFSTPVSHQDQIVEAPPHTRVIAASPFTAFGAIAYDDQPAISFQCHPELEPAFAKALIDERRERLPDPDGAITSLDRPNDRLLVGDWIRRFLEGSGGAQR